MKNLESRLARLEQAINATTAPLVVVLRRFEPAPLVGYRSVRANGVGPLEVIRKPRETDQSLADRAAEEVRAALPAGPRWGIVLEELRRT